MDKFDHPPFLFDCRLLVALRVKAFSAPGDVIYPAERIESEDDEVSRVVE